MNKILKWFRDELKSASLLVQSVPALPMTLFVLSLVMMNLLANKSIDTGVSWLALDAGITVSWLAFLTMDVLVKRFGPKACTQLSIIATIVNVLVALVFAFASELAGVWSEGFDNEVINIALDNTFAGTWYVIFGSTVAFVVASVTNAFLNYGIGKLFRKNPDSFIAYAARSYGSTLVAQLVDNLTFSLIVSLNFFGWTLLQCFTCAVTGAVVELVCEVLFSPIGYAVSRRWESQGIGQLYLDFISGKEPCASVEVSDQSKC